MPSPKPETMAERRLTSAHRRAQEVADILDERVCWTNGFADPPLAQIRALLRQVEALRLELLEACRYTAEAEVWTGESHESA